MDSKIRIYVILGMHRSGTSALTLGLNILGIDIGNKLLPPGPDNPKGYGEDIDILNLNEEMLDHLGLKWNSLGFIKDLDIEILLRNYFFKGVDLFKGKISNHINFGFKDPRTAKLLPFWNKVFEYCNLDPFFIITSRNPISISASLQKRNNIDEAISFILYYEHVIYSLIHTKNYKRILLDYDEVLKEPDVIFKKIANKFNLSIDSVKLKDYCSKFLEKSLNHNFTTDSDLLLNKKCPYFVSEIYNLILNVLKGKDDIESEEFEKKIIHWESEIARLKMIFDLIDAQSKKITDLESLSTREVQDRENLITELKQTVSAREAMISDLNRTLQDREGQIAELDLFIKDKDNQLFQLKSNIQFILSSTSYQMTRPLRKIGKYLPLPLKRRIRRSAKAAYWVLTPHKIPERLKQIKARNLKNKFNFNGLINRNWYLQRYPDVAANHQDPIDHYLLFGFKEGRDPNPLFDTDWYLSQNPDVAESGVNPLQHYMEYGVKEGRDPNPLFDTDWYLAQNPDVAKSGTNPLQHYLEFGQKKGRDPGPLNVLPMQDETSVSQLIAKKFPDIQPYSCYFVPSSRSRLSIVTDSIGPSSLFGGVGTALLFGTELANRLGATLRIVTRTEPADANRYAEVIASAGLKLDNALEIAMAPLNSAEDLSVTSDELFLTTSWWTTRATLGVSTPKRIIALVQEDERIFYAQGDERLRCSETLDHPDIVSVVNSAILFRHLTTGPAALKNIARNGIFFEPAFPRIKAKKPHEQNNLRVRRFFFYARPNNLRNLFWRGIEALDDAAAEGIFTGERWEMHWVGLDLPKIRLAGGMIPIYHSPMSWSAYQKFITQMDAGFVLMDAPHPSYPTFDLAAAGAAVLTTIYPGKESLAHYSGNILMAQPSREALVHGLRKLVDLANDDDTRAHNVASDNIPHYWAQTLSPVISRIVAHLSPEAN